jgi:hypothetical protein
MKRIRILAYILIILSVSLACEFAGVTIDFGGSESSSEPAAAPIEAGIDSPANGASLPMGAVDISYHASSTDGVSAVELSINGEVVSSIATPGSDQKVVALKYTWQPTLSGSHTIRVRAQNTAGAWSDYSAATVSILAAQNPQAAEPATAEPAAEEPKPTKTPEPTSTPEGVNFFDIKHDKSKVYYGGNSCGSHEITISTRVTNPDDVYVVVLFIRFADKESAAYTKWDSGRAMSKKDDDLYSVTLTAEKIPNYNAYEFAVLRYQMVAQDKDGNSIARTEVMEDLNLEVCP